MKLGLPRWFNGNKKTGSVDNQEPDEISLEEKNSKQKQDLLNTGFQSASFFGEGAPRIEFSNYCQELLESNTPFEVIYGINGGVEVFKKPISTETISGPVGRIIAE